MDYLRRLPFRAIALPVSVAILSIAGLIWFDRVWVPAQRQYLSERNLRILRALSSQMKARVDNFDSAIDHAIDSMPSSKSGHFNEKELQEYVRLFAPDLEIVVKEDSNEIPALEPSDPPRVALRRDEGRNYLYLAYSHAQTREGNGRVEVVARADIGQVAAPYLTPREEFDALLVVDRHGETIAQRSTSGLDLSRIKGLLDRAGDSPASLPATDRPQEKDKHGNFDRSWGLTNLAIVTIGPTDYVLFAQPMQLSVLGSDLPDASAPEEWALCGLVALNKFRAASSTIRTTYWLWIGFALAAFCLAVPLLKLRLLKPRERLRRFDAVSAVCAVHLLAGLSTFFALDLLYFGVKYAQATDDELEAVSKQISANVRDEASAIYNEMTQLEDPETWRLLNYEKSDSADRAPLDVRRDQLDAQKGADILLLGHLPKCKPDWSCRGGILSAIPAPTLSSMAYPYFRLATWDDNRGWQRIKWSTSKGVTPLIDVAEARFPYFESLKLARRLHESGATDRRRGVTVLRSPNTGEELTVLWRTIPPVERARIPQNGPNGREPSVDLIGQSIAVIPLSLTNPVLPHGIHFAVVNTRGRVLFHSDPVKSLGENFFREAEDHAALRSIVAGRGTGRLSAPYFGRPHRLFVAPLVFEASKSSVSSSNAEAFEDPEWSLVVFQDVAIPESVNLGTVALAIMLFGGYALMTGIAWALLYWCWPAHVTKWFWPDRGNSSRYRPVAAFNFLIGLLGLGVLWSSRSSWAFGSALLLAVGATFATFAFTRRTSIPDGVSSSWPSKFFWARASQLFASAIIPAIACYHVAYLHETDLVAWRGRVHLAHEQNARETRIESFVRKVALCDTGDSGATPCDRVAPFLERRRHEKWDVHVPGIAVLPVPESTLEHSAPDTILERLLAALSISTPPATPAAASDDGTRKASVTLQAAPAVMILSPNADVSPAGQWWLIVLTLAVGAYLLTRYTLKPLFVMDVEAREPLPPIADHDISSNELLVGPPGSGKSARLRLGNRVNVFDVRALAFAYAPSPVLQFTAAGPSSVVAPAGGAAGTWVDGLQQLIDPAIILGIDHLEYRLADEAFRAQMLGALEAAIYRARCPVRIASTLDPLEQLRELKCTEPEMERWARVLDSFHKETMGLAPDPVKSEALGSSMDTLDKGLTDDLKALILSECAVAPQLLTIGEEIVSRLPAKRPLSPGAVLDEIGEAADHYYRALWDGCARDEQVALRQLAEEGLVNPNSQASVSRLLRARLIRRDGSIIRLANESFRRFVLRAAPASRIAAWEHQGVRMPWGSIAASCLTVALGLGGLLLLTQQQLVDVWMNYLPALAPTIPSVWKLFAGGQRNAKGALA
jgi:hypothetical protein